MDKNEKKKAILEKYPRPSNVEGLSPPKLNSEIAGCLTESLIKQDGFMTRLQEQVSVAVSAIALPMNSLFSQPSEETNAHLQNLADASKLLTDVIHSLSVHRRYVVSNTIDSSIRKVVMDRPIDTYLFGEEVYTHIKSAQEVKKVSSDIKNKGPTYSSASTSKPSNKNVLPGSSGRYPKTDFLARRSRFNSRKKTGGGRKDQNQRRSWNRADYRK